LPNGPFQITKHVDYLAPVGDPVHRFFQMWQQIDGGARDLFVWVAETSGEGSQNRGDPASGATRAPLQWASITWPPATRLFRQLADNYALER
jgi:phospholipase C